ncbi:hypothetical protein [Acidilobus sp.]|uniref:hypothetical protein n=1 Tax=Acidilobus sp. TaxID=1872109 RepID=UPI003CFF296E
MEDERLSRALYKVVELEGRVPDSIADGSLEEALRELAETLSSLELSAREPQVVRRPYTGISTEVKLLSEMALALRLRMLQTGRHNVIGLNYFYHRLDQVISYLLEGRQSRGALSL